MSGRITVDEMCEDCCRMGPFRVSWWPVDAERRELVVLCPECLSRRDMVRIATQERVRLAEWGTLGQKAQATR